MRFASPVVVLGYAFFGLFQFENFNLGSGTNGVHITITGAMRTSSMFRRPGPTDVPQKCP
jgi:hypothetical protein